MVLRNWLANTETHRVLMRESTLTSVYCFYFYDIFFSQIIYLFKRCAHKAYTPYFGNWNISPHVSTF